MHIQGISSCPALFASHRTLIFQAFYNFMFFAPLEFSIMDLCPDIGHGPQTKPEKSLYPAYLPSRSIGAHIGNQPHSRLFTLSTLIPGFSNTRKLY